MTPRPPTWHALLSVARWTPSPHNTQPWKLRPVDERTAELYIDPARTLPDEDTTGCFIRCAMGMMVESLAIVSAEYGWRLASAPMERERSVGLIPFARLTLEPSAEPDEFASADILERRTSRLAPGPEPVTAEDLARPTAIAADAGHVLTGCSDPAIVDGIMAANLDAVCHDLSSTRYHDEIAGWFRYGSGHARRTLDGLESGCMNMSAMELYLVSRLPGMLNRPLTRRWSRGLYRYRLGPARQLAYLSGPFFEPEPAAPRAGRMLMRVWLALHRRGIGIHPFGNLVTNPAAHERLTRLTGVEGIWIAFRVGRTRLPPRSRRLALESLLCSGS